MGACAPRRDTCDIPQLPTTDGAPEAPQQSPSRRLPSDQYPDESDARCKGRGGQLPLHTAARTTDVGLLQHLITVYPEAVGTPDITGKTPLLVACEEGCSLKVLQLLIAATPQGLTERSAAGHYPLHCACLNSSPAAPLLVAEILKGYPGASQSRGPGGVLPCHLAAGASADERLFSALLEAFPSAATTPDVHFKLPLHHLCTNSHPSAVPMGEELIAMYPQALEAQGANGSLPLHVACSEGRSEELVRLLLGAFPGALRLKDGAGRLPLQCCWASRGQVSSAVTRVVLEEHLREAWYLPTWGGGRAVEQNLQARTVAVAQCWVGLWEPDHYPALPRGIRRLIRLTLWACIRAPSLKRLIGDPVLLIVRQIAMHALRSPPDITRGAILSQMEAGQITVALLAFQAFDYLGN